MSPELAQLLTTVAGIAGTLGAVWITHMLLRRSEASRVQREDQRRWHGERHRVCEDLVTVALRAERELFGVMAFLPGEGEPGLGVSSIWFTPQDGVPGMLTSEDRQIIIDTTQEVVEMVGEAERCAAALSLVVAEPLVESAEQLIDALIDALGAVEKYCPHDEAWECGLEVQRSRRSFQAQARTVLGGDLLEVAPPEVTEGAT